MVTFLTYVAFVSTTIILVLTLFIGILSIVLAALVFWDKVLDISTFLLAEIDRRIHG